MERRSYIWIAWILISVLVVASIFYYFQWMPVAPDDGDIALFSRGIGKPLLLWLNGYFGMFLNFQYLSPVGALAIPLIVVGLFRWSRLERWQQALLVFTVMAAAVIGVFGGFNYRYALTLQPLLVVAVTASVCAFFTGTRRTAILVALVILAVGNTVLSLELRQRVWKASPESSSPDTRSGSLKERLDSGPRNLEAFLDSNGVRATDTVLVNNLPIWYYVTQRPGIYFWCGSDQLFLARSKPFLFRGRTDGQVTSYLVDSLHCRYILSTREYDLYNPRYGAFLDTQTDHLDTDASGYTLYRLKAPSEP